MRFEMHYECFRFISCISPNLKHYWTFSHDYLVAHLDFLIFELNTLVLTFWNFFRWHKKFSIMNKKFTITDILLFIAAFLSLIFSEILYFKGDTNAAIFIGLWVPSILAFGIYLKLINQTKNDWNNTIFRRTNHIIICSRIFVGFKRNEK